VRRRRSVAGNIGFEVRIAEDSKNPSTLEIERSFGGPWIVGYRDLAAR
jgi:hypothetical protein